MLRRFVLTIMLLATGCHDSAAAAPVSGGEQLRLPSKILGETRTVFVSLPESYARGARRYPVLYLTDAQWQFEHTRAAASFLARNGLIPEIIVIGVTNTDRTRDLYATRSDFKQGSRTIPFPTSGQADRFLDFVEKELIPWAEARYRVAPLRILAGHSAGGNFALHAMRVRPALFQAIIAASPWLAWDDRKELHQLVPFVAGPGVEVRTLFLTCGGEGAEMAANLDTLKSALRARADTTLRWDSAAYPGETHDSVALKSYYDALQMIFEGWSVPRDPQTNLLSGSLDDMKEHFARLGERLGCPLPPPESTINELGYQYLQDSQLEPALAAFRYNTEVYPKSANVWDSLADALERAGKKEEALASCRKAVSLAVAVSDPNLKDFRSHAARLSGTANPAGK